MSEEIENGRNIRSRGGLVNRIKKFKCPRPVAQRKWGDCVTSVWLVELYVAEKRGRHTYCKKKWYFVIDKRYVLSYFCE